MAPPELPIRTLPLTENRPFFFAGARPVPPGEEVPQTAGQNKLAFAGPPRWAQPMGPPAISFPARFSCSGGRGTGPDETGAGLFRPGAEGGPWATPAPRPPIPAGGLPR